MKVIFFYSLLFTLCEWQLGIEKFSHENSWKKRGKLKTRRTDIFFRKNSFLFVNIDQFNCVIKISQQLVYNYSLSVYVPDYLVSFVHISIKVWTQPPINVARHHTLIFCISGMAGPVSVLYSYNSVLFNTYSSL